MRSGASRERGKCSGPAPGEPNSPLFTADPLAAEKALLAHRAGARKHARDVSVASSGKSAGSNQPSSKVCSLMTDSLIPANAFEETGNVG
jgi:hypothetical protein